MNIKKKLIEVSRDPFIRKLILLIIILGIIPIIITHTYVLHILILTMLFGFLAISWNILGGYAGQFSLGHSAFIGLAAYLTLIVQLNWCLTPWIGMVLSGLAVAIIGVGIGYPTFRLKGIYFALATIAFPEALKHIFLYFREYTGGPRGLSVPLIGESLYYFQSNSKILYYYFILGMTVISLWAAKKIHDSKFGLYLFAIREDENAAKAIGIPTTIYKLKAMAISAFFTAIGGVFYMQYTRYITPSIVFDLWLSVEIAIIAIIGGMYSVWGPLLGAFLLEPTLLITYSLVGGAYAGAPLLIYGIILMIIILIMPEGIIGLFKKGGK